jgi:hypothetical protein
MVLGLRGPGRVGRRRFLNRLRAAHRAARRRSRAGRTGRAPDDRACGRGAGSGNARDVPSPALRAPRTGGSAPPGCRASPGPPAARRGGHSRPTASPPTPAHRARVVDVASCVLFSAASAVPRPVRAPRRAERSRTGSSRRRARCDSRLGPQGSRAASVGGPRAMELAAPWGAGPAGLPVLPDRAPAGGVRRALPGDGVPASRTPVRGVRPNPACAPCAVDDPAAGGAGDRVWGRRKPRSAEGTAAAGSLPRPASRTPRPSRRPLAPARGASA